MKRSFRFIVVVLVATCSLSLTLGEAHARPRCNRRNCQQPAQNQPTVPAKPTAQPTKTVPPAKVGGIPLPNLRGCDARGHGQAISSYLYKIRKAMELIRAGLKPANNLFGSCKIFPTGLRNSCCTKFKSEAVKRCKEGVLAQAAQDHECSLKAVDCRLIRPAQCLIKKVTERKRAECCNWLRPQGQEQLLAYCDVAVEHIASGCSVAAVPTPTSEDVPVSIPQEPTPSELAPLEPVDAVVPADTVGQIPERSLD